ncbi:preprotein translocase subunit SecE [Halovulum sp. GXIMD14793]
MAKTNPLQFVQQVRSETAKVTWPSRRETLLTAAMVFVLSFLAAAFFYLVDYLIRWGVETFINAAS